MPAPISRDLRTRILDARQAGETTAEVAERFQVSPAFVRRLLQRHRDTGTLDPKTGPRGPQPTLAPHRDAIADYHAEHPDHTPAEIAAALNLRVAAVTVWRMLMALGLSFKKKRSTRPSGTAPTCRPPAARGSAGSPPATPNA